MNVIEFAAGSNEDLQSRIAELSQIFQNGDERKMPWDQVLDMFPEIELDTDIAVTVLDAFDTQHIHIEFAAEEDVDDADDSIGFEDIEKVGDIDDAMDLTGTDDLFSMLMADTKVPLLKAEEEIELAQIIERGKSAAISLKHRKVKDRSTPESLNDQQSIQEAMNARDYLARANSRLVASVAKRYIRKGLPFIDLISLGYEGLTKAINKFDWRRGNKFSTHATWWIRQGITRGIADEAREIRIPVHQVDRISRIYKAINQLVQQLDRDPTEEELFAKVITIPGEENMSMAYLHDLLEASRFPSSLQEPLDDEAFDSDEQGDFIQDDTVNVIEEVEHDEQKAALSKLMSVLPEREKMVMLMRYGLVDGHEYTLEEIGQIYNVTRERIRQIEAQALKRMRNKARSLRLSEYI
jgi:RNA polymerase primary sigma factor